MAKLSVDNGYRTANSGTAWPYFSFIADYFGFKEFYSISSFSKATEYIDKGYYAVASCGQGLFTTGGHYITIVGSDKENLTVYDPYYYTGKFDTASRKPAKVKVDGNKIIVSKSNFKKYANANNYFIFSNDKGEGNPKTIKKDTKKETIKNTVGKTKTLKQNCTLYSKKDLSGTKYTYLKNTKIKILKNISKDIDYIQVIKTGRKAYIKNKYFK